MADVDISIKIDGADELSKRIRKFGLSVLDLSTGMKQSGKYLSAFFSGQVFASRGSIIGHPWKPLNDKYAAEKARKFPGRPPLIRTGAMNRGYAYETTNDSLSVFNRQFYFRFHQNGEGVPQRITMDIDKPRQDRVVEFITNDIASKIRSADV